MYEYKFVKVELGGFFSYGPKEDHHAIIDEHARQGWRLVQIFAPSIGAHGAPNHYEIIFERPKPETR